MITYLKSGISKAQGQYIDQSIRSSVERILADIQENGDEAVRRYSAAFDRWSPPSFRLTRDEIEAVSGSVPSAVLDDIRFAQSQVRAFAEAQLHSLSNFEIETFPGVCLGQRNIPVEQAGCYVPGGKYPLVSSAAMSVIPARVAGVRRIAACTPPSDGIPPAATVAALAMAGADEIYILGGVQAVGALAFGTASVPAVDMIVGPGNAYVAEAKRQVFGRVGIDMIAGPSEVLVIADDTADLEMVAIDLLGQAEHGVNSPAVLLTTSSRLAASIQAEIDRQLEDLPTAQVARQAWEDYGQVILCETADEMVAEANRLAFEHVEVLTSHPQEYLQKLTQYGSLFLGPETTVPYGDLLIGTNHILPTNASARYTGGLWVGKFMKTVTYQSCTPQASRQIGEICARLSALEGIWGHQAQALLRVKRWPS